MVLQKAADSMKDKSNDEKKAVAGGIAFAVVVILFFGWAFFFFKKIQSGAQSQQLGGGAQEEFLGASVRDAQEALMEDFSDIDELRRALEQSGGQNQQGAVQQDYQYGGDQFGGSGSIE